MVTRYGIMRGRFPMCLGFPVFHTRILVSFSEPKILKKMCVYVPTHFEFSLDTLSLSCLQDILVEVLSIAQRPGKNWFQFSSSVWELSAYGL